MSKKILGQFYTTNYEYIFQGMKVPDEMTNIIEPFAGKGDLLDFVDNKHLRIIECYDIDPKCDNIEIRDTLDNPPDYSGKFVVTNPPYLARNKSVSKDIFDQMGVNDLYKCFIIQLTKNPPEGGIIIVPLNFWSSVRKSDSDIRRKFLSAFSVSRVNVFEEKVFCDTGYTVCSIQFYKNSSEEEGVIDFFFYPSEKRTIISFSEYNNYTIGGEIYMLEQDGAVQVDRLTKNNENDVDDITDILVKCIDNNSSKRLGLEYTPQKKRYIDNTKNLSARSYATLVINPPLSKEDQITVVKLFNDFMSQKRLEYNSLFLTNYRESNDIARKRISFTLVYSIVNNIIKTRLV